MNQLVKIFTKDGCMQCKMTKRFLTDHQIQFEEHNINQQPQALTYLKQQGFQSVPVVVTDSQPPIIGFRPSELKALVQ